MLVRKSVLHTNRKVALIKHLRKLFSHINECCTVIFSHSATVQIPNFHSAVPPTDGTAEWKTLKIKPARSCCNSLQKLKIDLKKKKNPRFVRRPSLRTKFPEKRTYVTSVAGLIWNATEMYCSIFSIFRGIWQCLVFLAPIPQTQTKKISQAIKSGESKAPV